MYLYIYYTNFFTNLRYKIGVPKLLHTTLDTIVYTAALLTCFLLLLLHIHWLMYLYFLYRLQLTGHDYTHSPDTAHFISDCCAKISRCEDGVALRPDQSAFIKQPCFYLLKQALATFHTANKAEASARLDLFSRGKWLLLWCFQNGLLEKTFLKRVRNNSRVLFEPNSLLQFERSNILLLF